MVADYCEVSDYLVEVVLLDVELARVADYYGVGHVVADLTVYGLLEEE